MYYQTSIRDMEKWSIFTKNLFEHRMREREIDSNMGQCCCAGEFGNGDWSELRIGGGGWLDFESREGSLRVC